MSRLVVLILHALGNSSLDGPAEYVLRCGAPGVVRAVLGVVCHVHPVPGLVYVKEGHSVQEAPCRFGGLMAGPVRGRGRLRRRRAQAQDGEAGVGHVQALACGVLPGAGQFCPHLAGNCALVCSVGGGVLAFVPSL